MKKFTYRIDEFTYNKVKLLAEQYHRTITSVLTELVQIGYIEKLRSIDNENKNIYK